jgi:hypothetical protein
MDASAGHASDNGKPYSQRDPGYRVVATGSTTYGPDGMFGTVFSANAQQLSSFATAHISNDTVMYN